MVGCVFCYLDCDLFWITLRVMMIRFCVCEAKQRESESTE
ncbi:hypothetical protein HFN_2387 [Helicobacter fennelliae MRY12-0050]|uniref:Uncharacterized protein n=1 Tax=Helicobacter fennelliae MRY12-0050 TaxID=1325130 RepID=T1CNX0_9HELI|nr:hypothetical protein HFN_2387 [Helicobacter fennelliae MRY12-0050]